MRQQRVQRRPLKRAPRRDLDQVTPTARIRRNAGADTAEMLLARIDQLLVESPRAKTSC